MFTPLDPTAVLAALITGNQRYVDRRAAAVSAPTGASKEVPHPFVVVVEVEEPAVALRELFDAAPGWIVRATARDASTEVAAAVEVSGCSLVVVLGRMKSRFGGTDLEFLREERRCFDAMATLLAAGGVPAAAVHAGRARLVGAIADDRDGRVHWLGEHPDQKSLLGPRK